MSKRERMERYKATGAAAGLVRVETLVPPEDRDRILQLAARLREAHRREMAAGPSREVVAKKVNAERVNDRAKLLMHRLIARRIASDQGLIEAARASLERRLAGKPRAEFHRRWEKLLESEPAYLRKKLVERTEEMDLLRSSSPLLVVAGFTEPELRRRIWRIARRGVERHG